ncbi:MAG: hypothetical protein V4659_02745 [Pseudomonadota bacterium]
MKFLLPIAAVFSMAAVPAIAAPVAAAQTVDRASASDKDASELGRGGAGFFIALLALAAIVAAIVIATQGDDSPNSP